MVPNPKGPTGGAVRLSRSKLPGPVLPCKEEAEDKPRRKWFKKGKTEEPEETVKSWRTTETTCKSDREAIEQVDRQVREEIQKFRAG